MALVDISREAVLTAINEFDRVGRKAFLEKYGFEPSRRYRIRHDGQLYDSKAISGAAHAHLPGQSPLKASEFSGGVEHAVGVLRRLGFEVIDERPADPVEAIVSVIANLRVAPVAGKPMLKQAIVLLWAIGQARAGADRLIEWTETVAALTPLLEEHRREGERRQGRPDYPIAALFHAGIWDLPGHTDVPRAHGDSAVRTWFAERSPQGGLPQPTYALARRSGAARVRMIDAITTRFFDDYDETGLLTAVGLYDEEVADDEPSSGRPSQDAVPEATSASPQADYARLCELVARRETRLHGQRHAIFTNGGRTLLANAASATCGGGVSDGLLRAE
jgi:5-methylcytosine-specific restriction enzyme A